MKAADLRKSILQAAVQGKLVPQNPHDEPATKLLERIRKEKAQLVKEGKIKKEKLLPPIREEEIPFDLPEGWVWCRLGEILNYTDAGKSPACKPRPAHRNEHGVIRTTAVQVFNFLEHENKVLSKDFYINTEILIRSNDILITRAGPQNRTGIACLVKEISYQLILSDKTIRLNCHDELLCKKYITWALNSEHSRNGVLNAATGMADSQVNISQKNISLLHLPLPPLREQLEISEKIEQLMVLCDALEAAEAELNTLESQFAEYLPKSILQAAVQGKLVPQNIHDEPADKLLERIRTEKAKLIKSGKLKKEKQLSLITEDDVPYDLPDGWGWCRLGEVISLISGRDLELSQINDNCTGIPYITGASAILNGKIIITRWTEHSCAISELGDLLVTCKGTVGKMAFNDSGALHIARQIMAIRFFVNLISSQYVQICIESYVHKLHVLAKSIIPGIAREDLLTLPIPIPPLAEQQRIVAKVNELMSLCDALKAAHDTPVGAPIAATVIPFPHQEEGEPEMLMAARGAKPKAPSKALQDARNRLFED